MLDPETQALLRAFEGNTLAELHHEDHVRAAWAMLEEHDLPGALERFPAALRRFAEARGAHDLYHETITWLYLLAINERRAALSPGHSWERFRASNPDLVSEHRRLLSRFYSQERLASTLARRTFVLPDRATP